VELARVFTGNIALNSWGEQDFWAEAVTQGNTTGYGPEEVLAQMPPDGIYVALVEQSGGPAWGQYGPEYNDETLEALWDELPCQSGSAASAIYPFYKWSRLFRLEVYCGPESPADGRVTLGHVLQSWRFDSAAPGDVGWALAAASQMLPEQVEPEKFVAQAKDVIDSTRTEASTVRYTHAAEGNEGNGTIYVEFMYIWDYPDLIQSFDLCPQGQCHTWNYQASPQGEITLISEGGAPLPEADRPTATPAIPAATLSARFEAPPFLYVYQNQLIEARPGQEGKVLADLDELGDVKATLIVEGAVYLLREMGLQRVEVAGGASETLQEFEMPVLYGELLYNSKMGLLLYSATLDQSCTESGLGGQIGTYQIESGTNKLLLAEGYPMKLLGVSSDRMSLYMLPVGCDPSYGPIQVISLASGQKVGELPTQGELFTAISPSARFFATLQPYSASDGGDLLERIVIYDLASRPVTSLKVELPKQPAHVWGMYWSPDYRWLYFTLASQDMSEIDTEVLSYGLWRVDSLLGTVEQVAGGMPGGVSRITANHNWLLVRHPGQAISLRISLQTGDTDPFSLPYPAIPGRSLSELPSAFSLDGRWLFVWHAPQGIASVVYLPSGGAGLIDIPEGAALVGWE